MSEWDQWLLEEEYVIGGAMSQEESADLLITSLQHYDKELCPLSECVEAIKVWRRDLPSKNFLEILIKMPREVGLSGASVELCKSLRAKGLNADFEFYLPRVVDLWKRRRIQRISNHLMKLCDEASSVKDVLQFLESEIQALHLSGKSSQTMQQLVSLSGNWRIEYESKVEYYRKTHHPKPSKALPYGIEKLDAILPGLTAGHLTIVGARPGSGKTTFAIQIICNLQRVRKTKVGFISMEMGELEIATKWVCVKAQIPLKSATLGTLTEEEDLRVREVTQDVTDFYILDRPSLSTSEIRTIVRGWVSRGVEIVVIDYLGLIQPDNIKENRVNQISQISRDLKVMAKEFDICVLCLAQLSRKSEENKDREPQLSHLRDSGSIEQDADEVIMLHRPEMYDPLNKPGVIRLLVRKNRFGPLGSVDCQFNGEIGSISELPVLTREHFRKI